MITCYTCETPKPDSHFGNIKTKNGRARCLKCGRDAVKKSYHKHKEKQVARAREYRANNPDAGREAKFKYKYGISLFQYELLFKAQNGKCAICDEPSKATLDVDHDHATGKVRGLLCRRCNLGIGHFCDDPDVIRNAMKYLGGVNVR
jgi:hypothetical protein